MPHVPAELRRRQIIEAAVRVITSEGAARTTTRRVAEEAEAPLASLHYTFESKEELFTEVIEHILDFVEEQYRSHIAPGGGLAASVQTLFELNYEWCRSRPEFHVAEYELFVWALRTPSSRSFARVIYERWFGLITEILTNAAGEEDVTGASTSRLARDVVAGLDGMLLQIIALGDDGPTPEDALRYARAALASWRQDSGHPIGPTLP
jgi:AcrR family transcriptional regulator